MRELAHNPKVTGSSPVQATKEGPAIFLVGFLFLLSFETFAITRFISKIKLMFLVRYCLTGMSNDTMSEKTNS